MARPDEEDTIQLAVGVPAEALKSNKLALKEAVSDLADTLMMVSEPFAVAYGRGLLNDALVIDIVRAQPVSASCAAPCRKRKISAPFWRPATMSTSNCLGC
jgi:hypothetical protein